MKATCSFLQYKVKVYFFVAQLFTSIFCNTNHTVNFFTLTMLYFCVANERVKKLLPQLFKHTLLELRLSHRQSYL